LLVGLLVILVDRLIERRHVDKKRQRAGAVQDANAKN
jgi:hypothetical protein